MMIDGIALVLKKIYSELKPDSISINLVDGIFVTFRVSFHVSKLHYQKSYTFDEIELIAESNIDVIECFINLIKESEDVPYAIRQNH